MKSTLIKAVFASGLLFSAVSFAGPERGVDRADYIIETLNLEGERADAVREAVENFQDRSKAIRESSRSQLKDLAAQQKQTMNTLLTEEEQATLKAEFKQQRKEKGSDKGYRDKRGHGRDFDCAEQD